jgi:hypothetical protein
MLAFCISLGGIMPALIIKNLPEPIYQNLKNSAQKHHRSMTREAIFLLEEGMASHSVPMVSECLCPPAYQGVFPLSQAMITRWKRKGLA